METLVTIFITLFMITLVICIFYQYKKDLDKFEEAETKRCGDCPHCQRVTTLNGYNMCVCELMSIKYDIKDSIVKPEDKCQF